jgi:hypothetical protein
VKQAFPQRFSEKAQTMKIKNVELSILRTELGQEVIPTHGAVDKMPQLVLVSVSTHEGIDGHYISYLIPSTRLTASKLPFTSAEEGGGYPFGPDSACLERPAPALSPPNFCHVLNRPQCVRSSFANCRHPPTSPTR